MSRIWWATILGILLGGFLLATVQRGCRANARIDERLTSELTTPAPGAPDPATGGTPIENLAPVTIAPATPNLGVRPKPRAAVPVEPVFTEDPAAPAVTRGKTRDELRAEAEQRRQQAQERAALARERQAERQARSRELSLQLAQDSGRLRPDQLNRVTRNITSTTTPSVAEAQQRFRDQLSQSRTGARAGGGPANAAAAGGATGDAPAGDSNSAEVADALSELGDGIPAEALQALADLGGIPGAAGGGGASPDEGARADTLNALGSAALIGDVTPVAVWLPAGRGVTPEGVEVASNDLYLGFVSRPTIPIISSRAEDGLKAPGGGFFTGAVDVLPLEQPSLSTEVPQSARRVETFATLGGAVPFFTPGSEPDPAKWGEAVVAEWATTNFDAFTAEMDPARFGDDRFYVWVGRFAAPAGVESVRGTLGVTWLDLGSFSQFQMDVTVPDCESCWLDAPEPEEPETPGAEEPVDPEVPDGTDPGLVLESFTLSPSALLPGDQATGVITLAGPAGAAGAPVLITISDPAALVGPAFQVVQAGQASASLTFVAGTVDTATVVTVTAELDGRSRQTTVTVTPADEAPAELDRLTILPQQILGGLTVQGTIRLVNAAPAGGALVMLDSSGPAATPPAEVLVPAGASSVRFDIQTAVVAADQLVMITARIGDTQRSADLSVRAEVFGDINTDGMVDGLDLAALLAALGGTDDAADLNGDGEVDLVDLGILIDLLESAGGTGEQPGVSLPTVSRWLPVPIVDCDELTGYRSADLFLGYLEAPVIVGVTSAPTVGLHIEHGLFYQHALGTNAPPIPGAVEVLPCLAYDSYLTMGETNPFFTPEFPALDLGDWGAGVVAEWLSSPGVPIEVVQDPDRFGDERFYVRIGRFTVPSGTRFLGGTLETTTVRDGIVIDRDVTVYHCPSCWGQFDLSGDGVVSDADVEIMIGLLGQPHDEADLDGDGLVDLDDLRLLIAAIGT